jgi:hypothetical protein
MSIYSPQRKAIYLSPDRLDLLHRRRGLSNHQDGCRVCVVQSGKMSWSDASRLRECQHGKRRLLNLLEQIPYGIMA